MSLAGFITGMGDPEKLAADQRRNFIDAQNLHNSMVTAETARQQRARDEAYRQALMRAVDGPEALAGGAHAGLVRPPAAATAATPATTPGLPTGTPVSPGMRTQYTDRAVVPPYAPNQSDAETARLSRANQPQPTHKTQSSYARGVEDTLRGGTKYATEQGRLSELRRLNPTNAAPLAAGAETAAEAARLLGRPIPVSSTPASSTPASTAGAGAFDAVAEAVKMVESRGDPYAVSPRGAVGPMQTMPSTLRDPGYGVRPAQSNTPAEQERVGRDYLRAMISKYPGRLDHALAAYNWGPRNADAWIAAGADPTKLPKETREYIPAVMARLGAGQPSAAGTPTAQAPTAGTPTAQAPAATFTPEQITRISTAVQQDLRIKQLQLADTNRLLAVAPDIKTAERLRSQADDIRFGAFQAQLLNASALAMGGDESAMSQLATAARVQYAQTPQGYVSVELGSDGQYRATTPPLPRETFINTLFSEASGAAAKSRAERAAAQAKAQGEIAVERAKTEGKLYETQAAAQRDLQKLLMEQKLNAGDVKDVKFNDATGKAYVLTNTAVYELRPGEDMGRGIVGEPSLVLAQ
ncbi:MAG: lytic transglycosylase domain-containing protein [Schleiferiaceae bacterium]